MNNNPFTAHNIEHLSPSTCNLFVASPAMFVLEKCLKRRGQVGCAAYRGSAVEKGIEYGLVNGASQEDCIQVATEEFWRLSALSGDPAREKERDAVPEMVKIGLKELMPYGKPTGCQGHIKYQFESVAVPFIGYYDFEWKNHNILIDLKTTHALPAKISTNHARQVALYTAAMGNENDPRLTYVTTKKCATYRLENVSEHVKALERIGLAIQRFLSVSEDPMELASMVVPEVDSFYFKDAVVRQNVFEIWGL